MRVFNAKKFREDLLYDRLTVRRVSRRAYARLVGSCSNGLTIRHVESGESLPSVQLFFNICEAMNKRTDDYFLTPNKQSK